MGKNKTPHRSASMSKTTAATNARADELGRAVHYKLDRDPAGGRSGRLSVTQAVVTTIEETYGLRKDQKNYAKDKKLGLVKSGQKIGL